MKSEDRWQTNSQHLTVLFAGFLSSERRQGRENTFPGIVIICNSDQAIRS